MRLHSILFFAIACLAAVSGAHASEGPFGIDHRIPYDDSGIWGRKVQLDTIKGLIAADVAGALWLGSDSRLGKTFWYSIDSTLLSAAASELLKRSFSRERPNSTGDPNHWFQGGRNRSFPSGEVTTVTAVITPFVMEYRHDYPAVYALELLPLYDGIARMKSHAHWQTDVLAGFAVGTAIGVWAHSRDVPLTVSWLPDGFSVGFNKRF